MKPRRELGICIGTKLCGGRGVGLGSDGGQNLERYLGEIYEC